MSGEESYPKPDLDGRSDMTTMGTLSMKKIREMKKSARATATIKKSKIRKNFFYQATLIIPINGMKLNLKLFRNGRIQTTGSKNISLVFWVIYKILNFFYSEKQNTYASPFYNCTLSHITDFKIVMINCKFELGFEINKNNTYNVIMQYITDHNLDYLNCYYDPLRHPAIQLKYKINDQKKITLMIFESGKIILSGATNYYNIMNVYKEIMTILLTNHKEIEKINYE